MSEDRPKIGVGVIIIKDDKVLLGKRINAHGEGSWGFAGGHLEFNEEVEDCAIREVKEETGISIKNLRNTTFTNDIFEKEKKTLCFSFRCLRFCFWRSFGYGT